MINEKSVIKSFEKFATKHLCQNLFFNKVTGVRPATLFKKRPWHRCFRVNFAKFLRTHFFTEHLWVTASDLVKHQTFWKSSERLSVVNYLHKKAPSKIFDSVLNTLLKLLTSDCKNWSAYIFFRIKISFFSRVTSILELKKKWVLHTGTQVLIRWHFMVAKSNFH